MAGSLIYIGIVLIVIAIIAYVLGARGMAGMTAGLGRTILIAGVVIGVILILLNFLTNRT